MSYLLGNNNDEIEFSAEEVRQNKILFQAARLLWLMGKRDRDGTYKERVTLGRLEYDYSQSGYNSEQESKLIEYIQHLKLRFI